MLALGLLVSVLRAEPARAADPSFAVRPEFGAQAGTETFELSATGPVSGTEITASSKLSYPVGTVLAGGSVRFDAGRFSLGGTAATNVVDPFGTLLDQDFLSAGLASVEFSHTDSRTTLRALVLEAVAGYRVVRLSSAPDAPWLRVTAGFRYESSAYSAYGASGWQLDENANQVPVSLPGDPLALRYDVRYRMPFIGVGLETGEGRRFVFDGEARVLASWSSHDDDHVLRHKTAHASAHGVGVAVALEPAVDLGGGSVARVFLGLSGQLQYVASSAAHLEQNYYADDPSLPGDQTGIAIPDASFSATSLRARLLAFIAVRF